jgi:hypothetical protein
MFRSFDWPPRPEVRELVQFLEQTEWPILLHCQQGLHRTGWASGVVLALDGRPMSEVRAQLTNLPRSLSDSRPDAGPQFFELYDRWLSSVGRVHDALNFRHWVVDVYCTPPYTAQIEILDTIPPRPVRPGETLVFNVAVTNRSDSTWKMSAEPAAGIRLGATILGPVDHVPANPVEWFRRPGRPGRDLSRAGMDDGSMKPGEAREFRLEMQAPQEPGLYLVQIDMVDEGVHWFSDLGTPGVVFELTVTRSLEPS